ncbi:MAG: FadR family transcriptional regulator [Victivallales bacterium]|nr:FadR family transcriptional regulator [Victivallales bacterium]
MDEKRQPQRKMSRYLKKIIMDKTTGSKKVYQQVVDHVQHLILLGKLNPGDRLPAERDMAERLKVSRNSVREALRALEILGITESRQGGGNYIRANSEGLFEPLSMLVKMNNCSFMELMEFRRMLETETAVLAAKRINLQQGEKLRALLDKMSQPHNEPRRIELDKELHFMLAEYSGNYLFVIFYHAISKVFESFIKDARQVILRKEENQKKLLNIHLNIGEAVINNQPEAAAAAVSSHFDFVLECL